MIFNMLKKAKEIFFKKNNTGLISNNVQDALEEIANSYAKSSDIPSALSQLTPDSTHRLVTDTEKTTWDNKSNFSGSYSDLSGKPTIPSALSQLSADSTHRTVTDTEKSTWNGKSNFSGSYSDLSNKPTIPSKLSDLSTDASHRTVSDTEKTTWNNKSNFSGKYSDLSGKPSLFDGNYNSLSNKPTIPTGTKYKDLTISNGSSSLKISTSTIPATAVVLGATCINPYSSICRILGVQLVSGQWTIVVDGTVSVGNATVRVSYL